MALIKQPNSRHCFVCGVENPFGLRLSFYVPKPGEVTAEYTIPRQFQGYPGVAHGGVVAAMLDEVAGRALMGFEVVHPRFMFTARINVRYRRNVPVEQPLRLVGQAVRVKSRTAVAQAFLYDQTDELLAEAEAMLVDVPPEVLASANLEALGWKIYPDAEPERPS